MLSSQTVTSHAGDFVSAYQTIPFYSTVRQVPSFSSFSEKLSHALIDSVTRYSPEIMADGSTDPRFFSSFYMENLSLFISNDIENQDLAVIFSKQMMIILKNAGIIEKKSGRLCSLPLPNDCPFRTKIFASFWNSCDWKDLFPSVPEFAEILQSNRIQLVEEILYSEKSVSIDELADEFLSTSRTDCKDILLFISYLDFTVLTWFAHFGFISYSHGSSYEKVTISVTDSGRSILKNITEIVSGNPGIMN